mgnify:CR=1 FL=1
MNNEDIRKEITKSEKYIDELRSKLICRNSSSLMYMDKKGKKTYVLQPKSQRVNLIASGWVEISKKQLIKELDKYEL